MRRLELPGAVTDRLFFAQVREDPRLEMAAFEGRTGDGPIAVVGSAGCTALSLLAQGAEVIGVDLNRTQNHLVELKAAAIAHGRASKATAMLGGAPLTAEARLFMYQEIRETLSPAAQRYWDQRPGVVARGVLNAGVTERLMRLIAAALRLIHTGRRVRRLLELETLEQQQDFYRREWDTAGWRHLFTLLCNRLVLRRTYDARFFDNVENPSYARHFRRVAARTLTELPVGDNYFLHHILTGRYPEHARPPYLSGRVPLQRLTLVDGGFTAYLRTQPDANIAGYALSNICEWLTEPQIDELFGEIVRTARPGARLVLRNFVGWTEVPPRFRGAVSEDRARGEELIRLDRSLCQRRIAICEVNR
jgi:S-adenosylmethionine-diacylglycerol 3-amino-3-carboxypropyl transferase